MDFTTLFALNLIVAIPCILYYYYYGVMLPKQGKKNVLKFVKASYTFTAFVIFYIPTILLYFLYVNVLWLFPIVFFQAMYTMVVLVIIFEYVNYWGYVHYEKVRLKK